MGTPDADESGWNRTSIHNLDVAILGKFLFLSVFGLDTTNGSTIQVTNVHFRSDDDYGATAESLCGIPQEHSCGYNHTQPSDNINTLHVPSSLTLGFAAVLEERRDGKTVRQQPLVKISPVDKG